MGGTLITRPGVASKSSPARARNLARGIPLATALLFLFLVSPLTTQTVVNEGADDVRSIFGGAISNSPEQ